MPALNRKFILYIMAAVVILIAVGLTIGNLQIVKATPGGYDFIAHWQGAKAFMSQGSSPYSDEVANQAAATLTPNQTMVDGTSYRFLAPFYSLVLYAPLGLIKDVNLARAVWMTMLEFCLFITGYISFRWQKFRKPLLLTLLVVMYSLFANSTFSALLSGNMGIFSLACLVFAITLIAGKQDEAAGLLMSFALFKPDLAYPLVVFILIWAIVTHRLAVLYWFLGTTILILGFSLLLIPDWPVQYFRVLVQYGANNPINPVQADTESFFGAMNIRVLILKNVLVVVVLMVEWFFVRTTSNQRFVWLSALTLAMTPWIGTRQVAEAAIFCIPGLFIALSMLQARWKERAFPASALIITSLFLVGWIFSEYFFTGISSKTTLIFGGFVLPLVVVTLLYWSRWWVLLTSRISTPN